MANTKKELSVRVLVLVLSLAFIFTSIPKDVLRPLESEEGRFHTKDIPQPETEKETVPEAKAIAKLTTV